MPPILKRRCKFTLRWLLDLENSSLEQNENLGLFAFHPCYFFICCLGAPWLTFGCYWGNSLTHLMLITTFGLSIFGPKGTWQGWVSTNWVPSGFWWQWHNPLSHSDQIVEKTLPTPAPRFSKMWNVPNTQNNYNLTLYCLAFRLA